MVNSMHKVTLIPGDGIGPEVTDSCVKVINATGIDMEFEKAYAGMAAMDKEGTPLPTGVLDTIRKNKVALKGPTETPIGSGFRSVNVAIRKTLDLYACLRPFKSVEGIQSRYEGIDLVMVRENTEDLYAGIEFDSGSSDANKIISEISKMGAGTIRQDSAISIKPISRYASERIIRFAFDYAIKNNRKKVTAVHKANIMKATDGLFMKTARKVAEDYTKNYDIEFEDLLIDNMCMQLVIRPELYDVIVAPNLYGDILSDLCAGLIGGLGVAPGANIGEDIAVFEPVHGTAPDCAGQDIANPMAAIISGVLMLRHLGENEAADNISQAIFSVIKEGRVLTRDLGGTAGTKEFTDYIISRME